MRRGFALIWLGATALVSAIVGIFSYQAGWAAGAAARLPAGAADGAPYYYGPHFFGFFGFLPFLFLLLVLLFVFRAGRWLGPWRGWGPRGGGYGRFAGTPAPPPPGEQWQEWPQRPPREEPPQGQ